MRIFIEYASYSITVTSAGERFTRVPVASTTSRWSRRAPIVRGPFRIAGANCSAFVGNHSLQCKQLERIINAIRLVINSKTPHTTHSSQHTQQHHAGLKWMRARCEDIQKEEGPKMRAVTTRRKSRTQFERNSLLFMRQMSCERMPLLNRRFIIHKRKCNTHTQSISSQYTSTHTSHEKHT